MALNLDPIKAIVEGFMVDECTISRDPDGKTDDLWDDVVGEYVSPPDDADTVYTGPCMIYPNSAFTERSRGDVPENVTQYWLEVPREVTDLKPEDIVVCTVSANDPALVEKVFILDTEEVDTYAVSRRIRMHDRKPVPT